jgi:hypothetical protein
VLRDHATGEPLLRANEAKRLLGKADVGTVFRLFLKTKIVGGRRIHLEFAVVETGRVTTASAIRRYRRRLSGLDADGPSPADLDHAHLEAEARLERAGL